MSELSYEQYLDAYGSLTYRNVGVSMMPMLKEGRDLFTVKKKTAERCKKYDVILYRRPPAQYVLHRVIEVRPEDYVVLGDNCVNREYGIRDEDIIGVMTSFVHDGRERSADDFAYRLYSRLRVALYPLRLLRGRIKRKLRR